MNFSTNVLTFKNMDLKVVAYGGFQWLTLAELARALYAPIGEQDSVVKGTPQSDTPFTKRLMKLFQRHSDEFTVNMTALVQMTTAGGRQSVRIFSLRGAHLLAMFARTPVAKQFRRWVLDILDAEVTATPQRAGRLTAQVKQDIAELCHEVAYIRSWWDHWAPAFREINPKGIAAPAHDHITMATAWATGLVRDLSLPNPFPTANRYSWLR